jgi:hypothetical protein
MKVPLLILCTAAALSAQARDARFEAGVQIGAIDQRDALGDKPALAGGRATVRAWRFVSAEAEINRFPIGGATANFPATEFLFGARLSYRTRPIALFATVRPGFLRFDDNSLKHSGIGTASEVNLGVGLAGYSRHHVFVRADSGDAIVRYGNSGYGVRHQFRGTFGLGVWF